MRRTRAERRIADVSRFFDLGQDTARQALDELRMLARLTRDVPAFLRRPVTLAESIAWQRERLANREQWLLRVAERQMYAFPQSPHARLLRAAGCEPGDFQRLVQAEGVDGALTSLAARGVYVTFDEFKGRREAVRGSQRFQFADRDFNNPLATAHYAMMTGGSRGRRSSVPRSLDFIRESGYSMATGLDAHGVLDVPQAFWSTGPVNHILRFSKIGVPLGAWFYPLSPLPKNVWLGGVYLALLGRMSGHRLPLPVHCDLQQPAAVVAWLCERGRLGQPTCIISAVSSAVRIAAAATTAGVPLDGVTFFSRSEPYTEAKQRTIEASGARAFIAYGLSEAAVIAVSCAIPDAPDDAHLFTSRYAIVQHTRPLDEDGPDVDALLLSTLTDHAPKTLLNVETGDSAVLTERDCGCKLGAQGMRTHLSYIRSFEKLTGEGMTFVRSNLTQIVESVLPARFGGTAIDYQVLEEERLGGLPRLVLRVSPTVGAVDEDAVRAAFLGALAQEGALERYMVAFWTRANTIKVERALPLVTPAGKILPFHLLRATPAR